MELDPCKWFDEDVRKLVHSVDVVDLETSLFPATSDEVVLDSEVLGSFIWKMVFSTNIRSGGGDTFRLNWICQLIKQLPRNDSVPLVFLFISMSLYCWDRIVGNEMCCTTRTLSIVKAVLEGACDVAYWQPHGAPPLVVAWICWQVRLLVWTKVLHLVSEQFSGDHSENGKPNEFRIYPPPVSDFEFKKRDLVRKKIGKTEQFSVICQRKKLWIVFLKKTGNVCLWFV